MYILGIKEMIPLRVTTVSPSLTFFSGQWLLDTRLAWSSRQRLLPSRLPVTRRRAPSPGSSRPCTRGPPSWALMSRDSEERERKATRTTLSWRRMKRPCTCCVFVSRGIVTESAVGKSSSLDFWSVVNNLRLQWFTSVDIKWELILIFNVVHLLIFTIFWLWLGMLSSSDLSPVIAPFSKFTKMA